MGELVLHIGTQKTGTTALQKFFTDNRARFRDHGWDYPALTAQFSNPSGSRNGHFLTRLCRDGIESTSIAREAEENMRTLEQSLSSFPSVLLSDEELFFAPVWIGNAVSIEDPMEVFWGAVSSTVSRLPVSQITVAMYIRRQDEWLASRWKEAVKHGGTEKSFAEYSSSEVKMILDYAKLIDSIDRALGAQCNVVLRLYDCNNFEGGSIFTDFCNAVGIPWDSAYSLPQGDLNRSISFDVAEALRHFRNEAPFGGYLRTQRLIPLAHSLSQEHPDPRGTTPFSEGEADAFLQGFCEGNARIAKRFFDRSELFPASAQRTAAWKPNWERIERYKVLFQKECQRYSTWGWAMDPASRSKASALQGLRKMKRGLSSLH